ncbi:hypothetical protein [Desulfogranum marinum]|uniref:hypothetical protein n=1 Tax=Desulfogranum marinum TaxID=453220 RepID=UPI0029C79F8E|nr:hypothetical protein [Desulfogranum marinum]
MTFPALGYGERIPVADMGGTPADMEVVVGQVFVEISVALPTACYLAGTLQHGDKIRIPPVHPTVISLPEVFVFASSGRDWRQTAKKKGRNA